jgi:nucleotide-binding universal stress UspA family protein
MQEITHLPTHRIVVGIDGSEQSRTALLWAMEQAAARSMPLDVVHVWRLSVSSLPMGLAAESVDPEDYSREAKSLAEREIDWAEEHTAARPTIVRPVALEGHAAKVLVDEAASAELLVVGARGLGHFAGMLLGSISDYCVRHAPTPVVVVHNHH